MTNSSPAPHQEPDHWLVRPTTLRKIWWAFGALLLLSVAGDAFIQHEAHFGIDGTFAFFAWYGFLSCVLMVLAAKALGWLVKRPESYYEEDKS